METPKGIEMLIGRFGLYQYQTQVSGRPCTNGVTDAATMSDMVGLWLDSGFVTTRRERGKMQMERTVGRVIILGVND